MGSRTYWTWTVPSCYLWDVPHRDERRAAATPEIPEVMTDADADAMLQTFRTNWRNLPGLEQQRALEKAVARALYTQHMLPVEFLEIAERVVTEGPGSGTRVFMQMHADLQQFPADVLLLLGVLYDVAPAQAREILRHASAEFAVAVRDDPPRFR